MFKLGTRLAAATTAGLMVAGLAACSSGETKQSSSGASGDTVTVWTRDWDAKKVQAQADAYMKTHSGISIEVVPVQDNEYLTKLANSIRAGSTPDLLSFDIVNATFLATQNQLLDITDRVKDLQNLDDLTPAGVAIGTLDGASYSLPLSMDASQMFWNKELFEKAGLDPSVAPANLDEVKAAAEKIQALGNGVVGFSTIGAVGQAFHGFPSAWADGGKLFTEPGPDQKATFDDPAFADMLQWYQEMWEAGLMQKTDQPNQDPGNVGQENVVQGNVGIVFTGPNALVTVKDEWNSAPGIPGFSGELSSFAGGMQGGIPIGAKNPDQAWDFLEWLVSDAEAAQIDWEYGFVPPDLALADSQAESEWTKNTVSALSVGQLPQSVAYFATINDPNGPWAQHSQAVIFQGADVNSEMTTATEEANQIIEDAYKQVN